MTNYILASPHLFGINTTKWIDWFAPFSYMSLQPEFGSWRNDEQEKRTKSVHGECISDSVLEVHLSRLHSKWFPLVATQVQLCCLASWLRIQRSQSDRPEEQIHGTLAHALVKQYNKTQQRHCWYVVVLTTVAWFSPYIIQVL
jgi:hypothetical protein